MNRTHALSGDDLVRRILAAEEGPHLETKRVGDVERKIRTICGFANSEGGTLILGIEDPSKAEGRQRVWGVQENGESVDSLRVLIRSRITPPIAPPCASEPSFEEVPCTLRDGSPGSIVLIRVEKSSAVHSVIEGGTYARTGRSTRQLSAERIVDLAMQRGVKSWTNELADVPFELLETSTWREYSQGRRLSRPIEEAMLHVGLARKNDAGALWPTRAAVLLFAEEPNHLLDSKCTIRLFHVRGDRIERGATPNLLRPPQTITGPLIAQITRAREAVISALASGVQVGPLGFEIVQRYPVRVLQEAIVNSVIHRDYRLSNDIVIRIFDNRITIESPGTLPGGITTANIGRVGSRPRNRALVDHLREFPVPPNLDAGEGVPMMVATMNRARLYPPVYLAPQGHDREAVVLVLLNETRPSLWAQVEAFLDKNKTLGNAEIRRLLRSDDPVRASKLLKGWVDRGLLEVVDPASAKQKRRYRLAGQTVESELFSFALGNHSVAES